MQTQTRPILRPVELIPAIGYIRVSTWFEEKISDEIQKASIEDGARRRGRTIVRWIVDLDATGRNFKRKVMEAIEAVETGAIEGAREIWVWKYSRFGRNRHGIATNLARVEHAGGQLISATEEIDATTATGRFTRGMMFELAAFESERIGESWRETHELRRSHGLPATGGPRFGYLWHQRELTDGLLKVAERYDPDPETAGTVLKLYEDYAYNDATFRELAEMLNEKRIYNPAATKDDGWSMQALRYYLDCGFPAGFLHVHRNDVTCGQRAKCRHVEDHYGYIPGAQPPILSDDLWAAYRDKRDNRKRLPPRARIAQYPYSGLAKCGLCGSGAAATNGSRGRRGYLWRCVRKYSQQERNSCPGSQVVARVLEDEVQAWLQEAAAEIDRRLRGAVVLPKQQKPTDDSRRRERIGADLAKIQKALDKASDAYAMDDMDREQYLRTKGRLVAQREKLDAELAALKQAEQEVQASAWEVRGAVIGRLLDEWDTLPVSGKRDLLAKAVKEIRLFPPGAERRVVCVPQPGFVF